MTLLRPVDPFEGWADPKPLPSELPPVAAFEPRLLPPNLRGWVMDIAERMQTPADFIATTAIVAAGSVVGRRIGIRPQAATDWTEVPNVWGLIVGRPGVMKSPAMKQALGPLYRLKATADAENDEAAKVYRAELERFKVLKSSATSAQKSKARKAFLAEEAVDLSGPDAGDAPTPPTLKRYIVNDTSYEALGEILQDNPNGVLAHRDEIVSLLKPLEREENAAARGFYLTAWNGTDGYTFDRITRGMTRIDACCLSLVGGTQPARLSAYLRSAVRGGEGDDGFAQRFGLLVWPDISRDFADVDRFPDAASKIVAVAAFERLSALDPDRVGAERDEFDPIPYLRFTPSAPDEFKIWRAQLEKRVRGGDLHPAIESHLAKYRGLAPKLALLLHLLSGDHGPVGDKPLQQALAWTEYLETHAQRAYSSVAAGEAMAARLIVAKLRSGELERSFTARDIHQRGWAGLGDMDAIRLALDLLVDLDWIARGDPLQTGGRPKVVYTANPRGLR